MKKIALSLIAVSSMFLSCSSDDNGDGDTGSDVNIPTLSEIITGDDFSRTDGAYNNDYIDNYNELFTRDGASTVSYGGQTTRLKQAKEVGGDLKTQTSVGDIQLKFEGEEVGGELQSAGFTDTSLNGTSRILRPKTSSSVGLFSGTNETGQGEANVGLIDDFIEWHQTVLDDWTTTAASGQAGTFLDSDGSTRYVTAKGFEVDQLFTKSMAGALAYDQAVNHYLNRLDDNFDGSNEYRTANDEGTVSGTNSYTTMEHHWDEAFGYIYGNITGENLIYKYIDNVDALDKFAGVEAEILEAFVAGRIAIAEKDYDTRDAQVEILREKLGLIIAVRAVHYLAGGSELIGTLAEDAAARADAFHDLCEGYGFVNSLRYVVDADGNNYFTDAEVDGFLATLEADNGFWSVTSDDLVNMADDIATKGVGGLSWDYDDVVN